MPALLGLLRRAPAAQMLTTGNTGDRNIHNTAIISEPNAIFSAAAAVLLNI